METRALPIEVTSFVGRRDEVAAVGGLLGSARLVTLTGPGGVGKTRVAMRVAAGASFARVQAVELADVDDPGLVAPTVAAHLDAGEAGGDVVAAVLDALGDDRVLLVLDNCERLVDAVAKLVDRLLRGAPGVVVLATSREPLGVAGEVVTTIAPLSTADPERVRSVADVLAHDGTRLLVERAQAVVPGFAVDEDNHRDVARLCHRLEGMPLAIELAAVRLRALSAGEVADRLDDRFRLLSVGRRGGPERHRTLAATVEWSHSLCTRAERALWARISVFSGGAGPAAVEGVCSGPDLPAGSVLDVAASLVEKSVLSREDGRFTLLETVREFGLRHLDTAEAAVLRARHRDFHADLVDRLRARYLAGEPNAAMAELLRERGNVRAALEYCLSAPGEVAAGMRLASALLTHWCTLAPTEGARWMDRLLAADPAPTRERAQLLCDRVWLPLGPGDPTPLRLLDEADAILTGLGLAGTIEAIRVLRSRAVLRLRDGDPEAVPMLAETLDRLADLPEPDEVLALNTRSALAHAHCAAGRPELAEPLLRAVLATAAERGDTTNGRIAQWNLGVILAERGEDAEAEALARAILTGYQDLVDVPTMCDALRLCAGIAVHRGRPAHAARLVGAADELLRSHVAIQLSAWEEGVIARTRDRARAALGADRYAEAHREGADLSLDEAIALALDERPPGPALTPREQQIADLVAAGMSNRAIAGELVISVRTVDTHVENILRKLGVATRTQVAVRMATGRDEHHPAGGGVAPERRSGGPTGAMQPNGP
ncbi:LuxR family transcriptional regulator [Actinokineospora soli]